MADGSQLLPATGSGRNVSVITFGCRLNASESEAIGESADAAGLEDAIIFNTCAVTTEAVRQARQAIRKARRERPSARLVVTGCAAQIEPATFAAMDEVDLVLGNAGKASPSLLAGAGERVRVGDIMTDRSKPLHAGAGAGRARAYIAIQNGCDHRCTFCVIPFGRGNARSLPTAEVLARVRQRVALGAREVVLTGVDLTSWGGDLAGSPALGELVAAILAGAPELARLRLSSIDAAELDPMLIACLRTEGRLMPHLHLSLQAGDDMVLKRMKRRHSRRQALDLIETVRAARPDIAIGADLIAGFPTEDEAAFQRTEEMIEEASLAYVHVFPFSPRPMTPAARMPQVRPDVVKARAARLRSAAQAALVRHLDRRMGAVARAMVEQDGVARAEDFTRVGFAGAARPGTLIEGALVRHDGAQATLDAWTVVA